MIGELATFLKEKLGQDIAEEISETDIPGSIRIAAKNLHAVCKLLYSHSDYYFDLLNCITGLDNGPEAGTMEVIYNLTSIPHEWSVMIKVQLDRSAPEVDSVSDIWRTANWLERETYDLLGIVFRHHPDLRRILLPADWEGFPLRKDYEHQEKYHGIKVKY